MDLLRGTVVPRSEVSQQKHIHIFLVEREQQLLLLKSQRLCDLLRFNLVYNILMKLTEALWVIPGNLVLISFGACHCQYVPSCLGLAPRPIGISMICLFPSGLQPKRCLYHRANLTLPILILLFFDIIDHENTQYPKNIL